MPEQIKGGGSLATSWLQLADFTNAFLWKSVIFVIGNNTSLVIFYTLVCQNVRTSSVW